MSEDDKNGLGRRTALKRLGTAAVGCTLGGVTITGLGTGSALASTPRKLEEKYRETFRHVANDTEYPNIQKSHYANHVLEVNEYEVLESNDVSNHLFAINNIVFSEYVRETEPNDGIDDYDGLSSAILKHSVAVDVDGPDWGNAHGWWDLEESGIRHKYDDGSAYRDGLDSDLVDTIGTGLDFAVTAASAMARTSPQGFAISTGYQILKEMAEAYAEVEPKEEEWYPPTWMSHCKVHDLPRPVPEVASTHFFVIEKMPSQQIDLTFRGKSLHQTPDMHDNNDARLTPYPTISLSI